MGVLGGDVSRQRGTRPRTVGHGQSHLADGSSVSHLVQQECGIPLFTPAARGGGGHATQRCPGHPNDGALILGRIALCRTKRFI